MQSSVQGVSVSDTAVLKKAGFLELGELYEQVAYVRGMNVETTKMWLQGPFQKLRPMLVDRELIVLPEDRTWCCLYSPVLVKVLAAYAKWHRFGTRHSVVMAVRFMQEALEDKSSAMQYLTNKMVERAKIAKRENVIDIRRGRRRAS